MRMSTIKCLDGELVKIMIELKEMQLSRRDYGGQIVETLEFRPDMSTSIE